MQWKIDLLGAVNYSRHACTNIGNPLVPSPSLIDIHTGHAQKLEYIHISSC